MEPGVHPSLSKEIDFTWAENELLLNYCGICRIPRLHPRIKHCKHCRCCIQDFDHHCPWLGNCIGRRNYGSFIVFISSLSVGCLIQMSAVLLAMHETIISVNCRPKNKSYFIIAGFISFFLVVLFLFSLIGSLTAFHFYLVSQGMTTHEYIKGGRNLEHERLAEYRYATVRSNDRFKVEKDVDSGPKHVNGNKCTICSSEYTHIINQVYCPVSPDTDENNECDEGGHYSKTPLDTIIDGGDSERTNRVGNKQSTILSFWDSPCAPLTSQLMAFIRVCAESTKSKATRCLEITFCLSMSSLHPAQQSGVDAQRNGEALLEVLQFLRAKKTIIN
jgi:hypothetical protein